MLIALIASLVSECLLFVLCCGWNWLLMCVLWRHFCIMNKGFQNIERPAVSLSSDTRETEGTAIPLCFLGYNDHVSTIDIIYILMGNETLFIFTEQVHEQFLKYLHMASCKSLPKAFPQMPVKGDVYDSSFGHLLCWPSLHACYQSCKNYRATRDLVGINHCLTVVLLYLWSHLEYLHTASGLASGRSAGNEPWHCVMVELENTPDDN